MGHYQRTESLHEYQFTNNETTIVLNYHGCSLKEHHEWLESDEYREMVERSERLDREIEIH